MEISERALKTYKALQERKKKRERQYKDDIGAVLARSYWRNYKAKYGEFYSLGHTK